MLSITFKLALLRLSLSLGYTGGLLWSVRIVCAIHGIPLCLRHRRSVGRLRARNGLLLLELCILGGEHCLSLSLLSIAHLDEALLCLKAVYLRGVGRSGLHHCAICYGGLLGAVVKVRNADHEDDGGDAADNLQIEPLAVLRFGVVWNSRNFCGFDIAWCLCHGLSSLLCGNRPAVCR